jgi:hypothetical protein
MEGQVDGPEELREPLSLRVWIGHGTSVPARQSIVNPDGFPGPDPGNPSTSWSSAPLGSLATLLWRRTLHHHGSAPDLREFTRLGLLTVPAGLVIAVLALWAGLRVLGG